MSVHRPKIQLPGGGPPTFSGPAPATVSTISTAAPPHQLGPYRIIRVIGEGGMGVVYEAEQRHPRRSVAVKVMRSNWGGDSHARRFAYEIEVLGRLEHPAIARIYDAGAADSGAGLHAYFAMELIHGMRLDEFVDHAKSPLRQRVELLVQISDAIQYAHQRGVIHRDLKPSNILVQENGQPKILDFGVARAIEDDPQMTQRTDSGQLVGTLAYMSPEQIAGDSGRVDTRSDVYALGVLAFQILCGRLPFRCDDGSFIETARRIRDEEPTRLGSVDRALRGDLEIIIGTAIAKESRRRYQSAVELAGDLRRWLRHEPISARPASSWYQLRKFARRNKILVGAAVAVMLTSLLGIIATTSELLRARGAEKTAVAFQRAAELRLAENDVARANGLRQSHHWFAAEQLYRQARSELKRLGEDPAAAELGLFSLDGLAPAPIMQFAGHGNAASALDISPDGSTVASGSNDGNISLWNVLDGRRTAAIVAQEQVNAVLFAPDGKYLYAASHRGRISRWKLDGQAVNSAAQLIADVGASVHALAISSSANALMACGSGGMIWTIADPEGATPAIINSFAGHSSIASALAVAPDGSRFATSGWGDNAVRVWDARTRQLVSEHLLNDGVNGILFSHDSTRVIASVTVPASRIMSWSISDSRLMQTFVPADGSPSTIALTRDGNQLVAGLTNGQIHVWDFASGVLQKSFRGHATGVQRVVCSPDGRRVVSSASDGSVFVWDLHASQPIYPLDHPSRVPATDFSPDGRMVLTCGDSSPIRIWDLATGHLLRTLGADTIHTASAFFADDGAKVLTATFAGQLSLIDLLSGQNVRDFGNHSDALTVADKAVATRASSSSPHRGIGAALATRDATVAITYDRGGTIVLWQLSNPAAPVRVHLADLHDDVNVALSPNGRWLAIGLPMHGQVVMYDLRCSPVRKTAQIDLGKQRLEWITIRFSPDSTILAAAPQDEPRISMWNTTDAGGLSSRPSIQAAPAVSSFEFTSNGKRIVYDNTVTAALRIADVDSGAILHDFSDLAPNSSRVRASPDGHWILVLNSDVISIWNLADPAGDLRLEMLNAAETLTQRRMTPHDWRVLADGYAAAGADDLADASFRNLQAEERQFTSLTWAQCLSRLGRGDQTRAAFQTLLGESTKNSEHEYFQLCLDRSRSLSRSMQLGAWPNSAPVP